MEMTSIQGIAGILVFLLVAWLLSENRRAVSPRNVLLGVGLQLSFALALLKLPVIKGVLLSLNQVVLSLESSTRAGTSMVFGYLGGAPPPFDVKFPEAELIFAFRSLPLVLLISALSSLLFYWGVLPFVVKLFSTLLRKVLRIGGAEAVGVGANVFMGMVESPLFIRPYLKVMTRSEIFSVMTCGMATIAGTVMVLYASLLSRILPQALGHLLTASLINVPIAVTISKIMIPETSKVTSGEMTPPDEVRSSMDAITRGTLNGVKLLINIIAMLIVLVALVHLANILLGFLPDVGDYSWSLQGLMGTLMLPVTWLMGIPSGECLLAGKIMGVKTILNELLAYLELSAVPSGELSTRSVLILTYAMCGFANPGSLGIMIGGMGTMAPERRDEIVSLGFRSIIAGTLATCTTGAVVGLLL